MRVSRRHGRRARLNGIWLPSTLQRRRLIFYCIQILTGRDGPDAVEETDQKDWGSRELMQSCSAGLLYCCDLVDQPGTILMIAQNAPILNHGYGYDYGNGLDKK
jgi:hypothetical protein